MALPLAQQQSIFAWGGDVPSTPEDILARYLHLREISKKVHEEVLKCVSDDALLNHARRLGLAQGKRLLLEDMDEIYYLYDLAIYTAPADRSRAIDRYAKSAMFEAQSDEGLMLDAMRRSQFAILLIEQRHDAVGLIATDILRNSKVWLLDVGIESSMHDGELIATRLLTPEAFSMTAGVMVPFEIEMLKEVCMRLPQRLANGKLSRVADDRRFAEAVYNLALADGVMDRVAYLDLADEA
ncbi:hypothetical protein [Bradyrhizobium sp. CB1015]|uniref:hypothetical protein n=1 Tax=Bradyrhizobium sp. CB1015 TaxID=2976822 RepID=UPI0021AAE097|nr:hypothetical protein [Bradyrhizobium sp. CB1015]UWU91660.1 hypothetical protein N2604_35425 [Bradyrhizobium sp. CB1015]